MVSTLDLNREESEEQKTEQRKTEGDKQEMG
jgi:hypothetical protein